MQATTLRNNPLKVKLIIALLLGLATIGLVALMATVKPGVYQKQVDDKQITVQVRNRRDGGCHVEVDMLRGKSTRTNQGWHTQHIVNTCIYSNIRRAIESAFDDYGMWMPWGALLVPIFAAIAAGEVVKRRRRNK